MPALLSTVARSTPTATCQIHVWRRMPGPCVHRLKPPSVVPPQAALRDLTCYTCSHQGRRSHAVEEGGAVVSYDEEGRGPSLGSWHSRGGRGRRELLVLLLTWERDGRARERGNSMREEHGCCRAQHAWEKRKREKDGVVCEKHTIRMTRFLSPSYIFCADSFLVSLLRTVNIKNRSIFYVGCLKH
jgi:hypothetical protein